MITGKWRTNVLLAGGVVLTLIVGLLLAQLDQLQQQFVPPPIVSANGSLTEPTSTPLPPIQMATATETLAVTETAVVSAAPTATPAAVAILPSCDQIPDGWQLYIVNSGDTLSSLSIRFGLTVDAIVQANCLEMRAVEPGMEIYLPTEPQIVDCGYPPLSWVPYVVRRGDTLSSLARNRGTTVYRIMNANCLTSTYLEVGKQIYLPPARPTAVPPTATMTPVPTETPTLIATGTSTPPASGTPTATGTVTTTPVGTPTSTTTATPAGTVTATPTAVGTATGTPVTTVTATPTGTLLPTGTATATPIGTPTPTSTGQPTATSTALPTPTATILPTSTSTALPTATPTQQPPPTRTPLPPPTNTATLPPPPTATPEPPYP